MWIKKLTTPASDPGALSFVLRLTAIIILLRPMGPWWISFLLLGIAVSTLIFPRILHAPATWYVLALLVAGRIIEDWPLADNHIYLLAYWCLAIGLALGSGNVITVLGRSSRLLVGLAFLFAVIWKGVLSPDYLDGRFFRVTYLTDPRFENLTTVVGNFTIDQLAEAREYLKPPSDGALPRLHNTPSFTALVYFSTWWTILIEALCAFFFLVPFRGRFGIARHVLLLTFCVTTYALAPVLGLGLILLTMGLASVDPENHLLRTTYFTAWLLVLAYYMIPWVGFVIDGVGYQWFATAP
ncbi:MAG TPA: hypothetical protein VJ781_05225 [Pyrinomonadaceae bacterium]|jgi:hypothetical protein|nr:hypothetical protein [Pyrinomonadaceae bacterium]